MITIISQHGKWEAILNGKNLGGRFATRRRAELEARLTWGNLPFTYVIEGNQ
jgi:hypothetical protein